MRGFPRPRLGGGGGKGCLPTASDPHTTNQV